MIIIALGANLEWRGLPPETTLRYAVDAMRDRGLVIADGSPLYKTAPVPVSDQPWFHNAVVALEDGPEPHELLRLLNEIEHAFGRERGEPNAPRILDLDIIAWHEEVIEDTELSIPHPRMQDRAFVLYPLRDIDPHWLHPVDGVPIRHYIGMLPPEQDIQQLDAPPVHQHTDERGAAHV